jgi:peptidylprolyl isomerase
MKKGEIRKLEIPAEMAYGDNSVGAITPGSDLVFEVEMIDPGK